jgi:CcmD family protein
LAACFGQEKSQCIAMNTAVIKAITAIAFSLFPFSALLAQSTDDDFMRSMGKMYVVVAVIAAIFIGIVLFLVSLDRKLTKLENQIKNHD